MKTLLRVDASLRVEGSRSRALADHFEARWIEQNPDGRIVRRDLAREPVPHLDQATVAAFGEAAADVAATALSDRLVDEIAASDVLLVSSPVYNFGMPSGLKAWIDHVVRSGRSFVLDERGARGLLGGRRAFLVTARGAPAGTPGDLLVPGLERALAFVGLDDLSTVELDGTADDAGLDERVTAARARIDEMLARDAPPTWVGDASDADRRALEALRAGQADAIVRGDADAYARLCSDDVRLMLPGHDLVAGRDELLRAQRELFGRAGFAEFVKRPERVEVRGDLAVETGRQRVRVVRDEGAGGVFAARQKYTHVFRRTADGWRFAVLMSNPSG